MPAVSLAPQVECVLNIIPMALYTKNLQFLEFTYMTKQYEYACNRITLNHVMLVMDTWGSNLTA